MLELTKALSSVPEGKEALEKLNALNERFQKKQLKNMMENQQTASPSADPKAQLEAYIDSIQRQQADLAIQVNNLHRMYTELERKSAPWKSRLQKERQQRIHFQEKTTGWYQEYRMDRAIASDILAKADAPSMLLDNQDLKWSDVLPAPSAGVRVLVHGVVSSGQDVETLLSCEKNIPYFHDLCLTTTGPDGQILCEKLAGIDKIQSVTVRKVTGPVSSLTSLIGIFGQLVSKHEFVLNLDFQKLSASHEGKAVLESLSGSKKRVEQIFSLFQSDGKTGLFYVRDLRQKEDPFLFTFEDCESAEQILSGWNVDFEDTVFSFPSLDCFWGRTEILRPVIGERWVKPAADPDEEDRKEAEEPEEAAESGEENEVLREENTVEEDRKAFEALSKMDPAFLSKSIGYLCDQKSFRPCVTAPGSDYIYGDVHREVREQFTWTDLSRIGLKKFEVVCLEIRDTMITSAGNGRYCARRDVLQLYQQLQNLGVTLFVFNDLGPSAEKVLKDCGYENWDVLSDRAEEIPLHNACLICAHRVLPADKSRNMLVLFSSERLLSQMPSGQLEAALEDNEDLRALIVGAGICNEAGILSEPEKCRALGRRYAAALQCRGFLEAAEKAVPDRAVVLTIGREGYFLKELWEQQTGRSAVYLPVAEDFLHQASVCDEESFDGMLNRIYKGTLDAFLRESFGLKVRGPYSEITMNLPHDAETWEDILGPVRDLVVKKSAEARKQCREMMTGTVPAADHYVLLTFQPSARIRYELSMYLKAPVDGVDFYQLQKAQRGKKKKGSFARPVPFLDELIVKPSLLGEDDRLQTLKDVEQKRRMEQDLETADQKEQKELLKTCKRLESCGLKSIAGYSAVSMAVLQMAESGEQK